MYKGCCSGIPASETSTKAPGAEEICRLRGGGPFGWGGRVGSRPSPCPSPFLQAAACRPDTWSSAS